MPATTCGTLPCELRREAGRRLADQIGLANARKEAGERGQAAGLGLAAGDPENVREAGQRLRGGVRIGGLGVVDEQHVSLASDLLHAVREPGKRPQPLLDRFRRQAERERGAGRAGGVLRVVHAAQRADPAERGDGARAAAVRLHDLLGLHIEAVGERVPHRDAHHALAGARDAVGGGLAPIVVDADDGGAVLLRAGDQPLLDGGVVGKRAVAVEVVFGDVDQDADRGVERRRQVDLIGRDFDHVHAQTSVRGLRKFDCGLRRLQREDRGADIAADLDVVAGGVQQVCDQRGGGGFAVGAGDGDERRVGRAAAALAAEQLDVADHLDRRGMRQPHGPVRRRMRQRHARRKHQRGDPRPVDVPQIGGGNAGARRLLDGVGAVVPADHVGAAGQQRARARQPRAAEAEHRDFLSGEGGDGDHRSFSVDSPASASTTEMIQKRITICGSVQPSCSK